MKHRPIEYNQDVRAYLIKKDLRYLQHRVQVNLKE